ncbi:hypothetical protein Glove_395g70 [Diversispora epigaea]|uniref:Uncharacterized protein n=1 Tax=Diversispora epigaea TaxID=1348612 RepID=A0A397H2R4_9GLOM|nr:hypothetical protein Glove_395g70 [Diversispora epigaea]
MKFNAILILGALSGFFITIQAIPVDSGNAIEISNGLKARDATIENEYETDLEKRQRTSNTGYNWYRGDGNGVLPVLVESCWHHVYKFRNVNGESHEVP